ncbi:MAG: single-stranded-DNA-specific exonuclease RecJ [Anaerolinea sp.]|nr:single-stranded-DNA-specific exonuclease RecJ [Anaerolinea sp.]
MSDKRWIDPAPVEVSAALREAIGGHPLIAEALARRGITDPAAARAFLDPAAYTPPPAFELPDLMAAVEAVARALRAGGRIAVWGDFDVDGQTATALLVEGLRALGGDVVYHIPLREPDGHGVHIPQLRALIDSGVHLLLTCDTGIAAHDAIAYAAGRGVTVVVTDHHNLPDVLPSGAAALVDPKRLADPAHPLRTLPGVGVAHLLMAALAGATGRSIPENRDLVALGIVADVADQVGMTRWLLQRGLAALAATTRPGLRAIMENAGLVEETVREEQIGFQIGPRLNALGRLGDATLAVELLITNDPERAFVLAAQLEMLNAERRLLTEQIVTSAQAQIAREPALLETDVLVLAQAGWHPGVLGIVASRLVEAHARPVVLLELLPDGTARGSARSVEGCDIGAAIAACADLLISHGGHAGAAGVRLAAANIDAFRRAVSRAARRTWTRTEPALLIDAWVTLAELTPALAAEIERLAPFGAGNPPLTLAVRDVTVQADRVIGRTGDHRLVTVSDAAGATARVLWWGGGGADLPRDRFDLALTARARDYRGQPDVQLVWLEARPAAGVTILSPKDIQVIDCRGPGAPALHELRRRHDSLVIWAEGAERPVGALRLDELTPAQTLAIWTSPPAYAELRATLNAVRPAVIYVYANDPGVWNASVFMTRLSGMVKHALNQRDGRASVQELASALGQRALAVRAGLRALAAQGWITIDEDEAGWVHIAPGGRSDDLELRRSGTILRALLHETALFWAYWRDAPLTALADDIRR